MTTTADVAPDGVSEAESAPAVRTAPAAVAYGGELLGTFVLVFAITATVVATKLHQPIAGAPFGSVGIALVNGLALAAAVAALGHVSGAHLNPAVSVALAAVGRFPWSRVPGYVVAQVAGAILAGLATWVVGGAAARSTASLGATALSPGVSEWRGVVVEALVTFLLVLVVIAVSTDDRVPAAVAPVAIGAVLTVAVFIAGPLDGAAVNPARALGPMIVAGSLAGWWVFLVGPLVGGVVGALLYDRVLRRGAAPAGPRPAPRDAAGLR